MNLGKFLLGGKRTLRVAPNLEDNALRVLYDTHKHADFPPEIQLVVDPSLCPGIWFMTNESKEDD